MCFSIRRVVGSCALGVFLFSGVAVAAQGATGAKEATEQCAKGGKILSNVKTNFECVKQGGAWVKIGTTKFSAGPQGKSKAVPSDPLEKNKVMRPPDPLEKNRAMPPAGQIAPSGGQ